MSNTIKPLDQGMLTKLNDKPGSARETTPGTGAGHGAAQRPAAAVTTDDTVDLTRSAQLLAKLEDTLAQQPDIDPGRVEAVKASIANGDYKIDTGKIAEALLRTDREIGG